MKILITGICGFVGSTIAKAWIETTEGVTVYGLDNLIRPGSESNRLPLQKLGIKFFHADIRAASDLEILPKADWVIDTAANPGVLAGVDDLTSSRQLVEHNLLGTVNVLEYCKRHGAGFVLISTSRVYSIPLLAGLAVEPVCDAFRLSSGQKLPHGLSEAGVSESFSTSPPISLYGSTKKASETLALEYGGTFNFPVWINRCGILAGAGQFGRPEQGLFSYWINAWLRKQPITYYGFGGKGYQVRDCLHPGDLLPLLKKQTASGASVPDRIFNLGGGAGNAISLAELSRWCAARFGPRNVSGNPDTHPFDIPWLLMDSSLASKAWGWKLQTPLNTILEVIARHAEEHPEWLDLSGQK